jgi:hypothetical protein
MSADLASEAVVVTSVSVAVVVASVAVAAAAVLHPLLSETIAKNKIC